MQEMEDPGAPPPKPPRYGVSEAAKSFARDANNPLLSDEKRAWAARQFELSEAYRKEFQTREDAQYVHDRQRWETKKDAYDKFKREAPDRDIKQLGDLIAIEKAQHEAKRAPIETALKQAELDRDPITTAKLKQELENLRVDHEKKLRDLNEPTRVTVEGTPYEEPYRAPGQPRAGFSVPPGIPAPKDPPLTNEQAEAVRFVAGTKPDLDKLERLDNGKVLTNPTEHLAWGLPGGNFIVSDKYREAKNAATRFEGAYMKIMSGAAVHESEAKRNLPAFIPAPGDDPKELAEKARRRREFAEITEKTSGANGIGVIRSMVKDAGDKYEEQRETKRDPVVVQSPDHARELERTGVLKPGRRLIDASGNYLGTVPRR